MSDFMNRAVRCNLSESRRRPRVSRSLRAGFWIGLGIFLGALAGMCGAAEVGKAPGWADTAPLTKQNVVLALGGGGQVRVDVLADRLFRVRYSKTGQWTESGLNRYGVLAADFPEAAFEKAEANGVHTLATKQAKLAIRASDGAITLADAAGKPLTEQAAPQYQAGGGYDVRFALSNDERLYGLGDVSRENVMRRGGVYEFWVLNVKAYIPIPVVFSSRAGAC